jgi:hypothetical protein
MPSSGPTGSRRRARPPARVDDDPYAVRPEDALDAVRPEDALDAARREVKRRRMDQPASVRPQHHLDPLTGWFVLARDAV